MLALGLVSGEVALYRIGKNVPVRMISLAEWGYEPETTGSVSDIAWSPDDRALAVSPQFACEPNHFDLKKRALPISSQLACKPNYFNLKERALADRVQGRPGASDRSMASLLLPLQRLKTLLRNEACFDIASLFRLQTLGHAGPTTQRLIQKVAEVLQAFSRLRM
jgi:hypothetical protein